MPRQYHKNPRQITKKQDADLESSLLRLGDISGIVHNLETDEVIGGNQRGRLFDFFGGNCETVLTEQYDTPDEQGTVALGYAIWQGKKYSYRQVRWDEKTAEEANIVANKAGGTWDFDILGNEWEIDELLEWGFEPFELGLDDTDDEDPAEDPGAQVDRAEELREKWGVETGQLWQLGAHRLICGDCTDPAVVERVMGGERAALCVTDPPYGVDYDAKRRFVVRRQNVGDGAVGAVTNDDVKDWIAAFALFSGDVFYIWHADGQTSITFENLVRLGFVPRTLIVWKKNQLVPTPYGINPQQVTSLGLYHYQHELCWYGLRQGKSASWVGGRDKTSVWEIDKQKHSESGHSTEKPIECMSMAISNHNFDLVYDPFLGSGTTLIACEQLGRRCRAVEISPAYVAVALQRWADMTGQTPTLLTD
mgnify:CR=1 FL=1